jgi:hypothetical protein
MVPGIFNSAQLSSNKLLRSIEEAKNDAAEFFLSQLYLQSYNEIIDANNAQNAQFGMQPSQTVYGAHQMSSPHPGLVQVQSPSPLNKLPNTNSANDSSNNLYQTQANLNNRQQASVSEYPLSATATVFGPQILLDPTGMLNFLS